MVSAILNAALVMMGVFVFLAFLVLSFFVLLPILYCVIAELYKWIKSKFD